MSTILDDIIKRSKDGGVRKEDLVPISVKITKKVPYYDWTTYYVQFKNKDNNHWVRWNIPFPKSNMKIEDILPILAENGLDAKNISKNDWPELVKGSDRYQEFKTWRTGQYQAAKIDGSTEKKRYLDYSYTSKKLRDSFYLISVTMRMYGCWRKFKYVFDYDEDNWSYEDDETGKTRYTPISEAISYDVEGMIAYLPHTCLTKEEWDNDDFFKEMYSAAKETIKRYNSRNRYW